MRHFLAILVATLPSTALAGYGHSWTWKKAPDSLKVLKCIAEMKRVLAASPVKLAGTDGLGKPMLQDGRLEFNLQGHEGQIGEPFLFPGRVDAPNFCKTNGLPYDPIVTACLLVLMDHFSKDEVDIQSDGKLGGGDWDAGIALYKKVFQRDPRVTADSSVGAFLKHIDLKPTWGAEQLVVVFVLALVGVLAYQFFLNPRPDFTILVEPGQNARVMGRLASYFANAVTEFFRTELAGVGNVVVKGWIEHGGRFRLSFTGGISDKDQQRVRNFFGMLRKR